MIAVLTARRWSVLRQLSFCAVVVGAFLPWLRVAGRTRNGAASANLLLSLADDGWPAALRSLGLLWYTGALAVLAGWALATSASKIVHRWIAGTCLVVGTVAWAIFALWSIRDHRVLAEPVGPVIALVGCAGLITSGYGKRFIDTR